MRLAIVGGPNVGKTTAAAALRIPHYGTDGLIAGRSWSEVSSAASALFDHEGELVVEGCATVRALRKWLERNPTGRPVDTVWFMNVPLQELTMPQERLRKGIVTVFQEIMPELIRRGVEIDYKTSP